MLNCFECQMQPALEKKSKQHYVICHSCGMKSKQFMDGISAEEDWDKLQIKLKNEYLESCGIEFVESIYPTRNFNPLIERMRLSKSGQLYISGGAMQAIVPTAIERIKNKQAIFFRIGRSNDKKSLALLFIYGAEASGFAKKLGHGAGSARSELSTSVKGILQNFGIVKIKSLILPSNLNKKLNCWELDLTELYAIQGGVKPNEK